MNKVVHFEIPADDTDRAKDFYAKVFGWGIQATPGMPYHLIHTTEVGEDFRPKEPGAINGGMMARQDDIRAPVITIGVDDMAAAVAQIEAAGGRVVRAPFAVGDMGTAGYFEDTEGNVMGLWQPAG